MNENLLGRNTDFFIYDDIIGDYQPLGEISEIDLTVEEEVREEEKPKPNPIYVPKHIARRRKW